MKLPALVSQRAVGFGRATVERRAAVHLAPIAIGAARVAARRRGKRASMATIGKLRGGC